MDLWKRRALQAMVGLTALVLVSSLGYHYAMVTVEGSTKGYFHHLQVVVETFTGTGYGSDAGWESPLVNLLVIVMDLSTFLLLFIVLPYVFQPILAEALSPEVPTAVEATDHVLVCGYTPHVERLVTEFETLGVEYALLVDDPDRVADLIADGVTAVHGDPTSTAALRDAGLESAASVVLDTPDEETASVVLAVREVDEDVRTVAMLDGPRLERYVRYAGADAVLTPRDLLGRRIAERVESTTSRRRTDALLVGEDYAILEVTIDGDSDLAGEPLESCDLADDPALTVAGLWSEGEFVADPDPDATIEASTSLLVAGERAALRRLERRAQPGRPADGLVIVAGHGEVGSIVADRLRADERDLGVIDCEDAEGVDVVGDATEEETLLAAGLPDASTLVVALGDDDEAILTVLVARELADEHGTDLEVVVRVNDSASETKVRRAGSDYVLGLPDISGRLLALEVLREQVLSFDRQLKVVRVDASRLAGQRLADSALAGSGSVVVAVERDDDLLTDVSPEFVFERGDRVLLAGDDEAIDMAETVAEGAWWRR